MIAPCLSAIAARPSKPMPFAIPEPSGGWDLLRIGPGNDPASVTGPLLPNNIEPVKRGTPAQRVICRF
jgi:hypothetical protein